MIRVVSRFFVFLFLHKNICCGYSLWLFIRSASVSNEYPQHVLMEKQEIEKKKNIASYLEQCLG